MNEQNQNKPKQRPEETPKTILGGSSAANSNSGWRNLISKRWVTPAIFMAAAAIIVTLMWIYQGDEASPTIAKTDPAEVTQGENVKPNGKDNVLPVTAGAESMVWPVASKEAMQVELPFFDAKASEAEREEAVVQVGENTFAPHMGIDFVDPSGNTFDVLAALSGKVTYVKQEPTNGYVIEITHNDGLVTVYQSVTDVQVAEGDEVLLGTVIAKAGRSDLEKDLGIHLHYETRANGKAVNPSTLITEKK